MQELLSKLEEVLMFLFLRKVTFLQGLDIPTIVCGICNSDIEDNTHVFLKVVSRLRRFIENWCDMSIMADIEVVILWIDTVPFSIMKMKGLEAIVMVMWSLLWNFRKNILFSQQNSY
ncbi:unnamed protein product [Lactuca saligna]|uniref:Uncharacterized protein n=1 Tax=Lactuca saligna TaxID=75948 RepID=A0AA35YB00_LACSI|nr:unnamed protein product [Lactuca saligna]